MNALRAISIVLLSLSVLVGSVTMSVARHQARAVGEMVLCTGYGMVTVSIDAEGRPTGPMLPCPECVPAFHALTEPEPVAVLAPSMLAPANLRPGEDVAPRLATLPSRHPRGPPVTV